MTYAQIKQMVENTGFPYAYHHFAEGESPDPPFVVFLLPGSVNFAADDSVYVKGTEIDVELYTDEKDPEAEGQVEAALDAAGMYYEKLETWIESEKMYEVVYSMEETYEQN